MSFESIHRVQEHGYKRHMSMMAASTCTDRWGAVSALEFMQPLFSDVALMCFSQVPHHLFQSG